MQQKEVYGKNLRNGLLVYEMTKRMLDEYYQASVLLKLSTHN